ncbi:MAG: PqqD family protein [Acutalibacteraceae bacterium]
MKLKDGFVTHMFDDTQVLIGTEEVSFKGIVNSNRTAAFIVDCLKTDTTESQIVEKMLKKYDVNRAVVEKDVHLIIQKLRGIGAIDE